MVNVTAYRLNAKELDPETGLYYYGARYYNPQTSIWLSTDPLAHMYPHLTPYNFVENNPVMLIDPTGMNSEKPDWFINQETGDVIHAPGQSNLDNVDVEGKEDYVRFATDEEFKSRVEEGGKQLWKADYEYKKFDRHTANFHFSSLGVSDKYYVSNVQHYQKTDFVTQDYEPGGMVEKSITHEQKLARTQFLILGNSKAGKRTAEIYNRDQDYWELKSIDRVFMGRYEHYTRSRMMIGSAVWTLDNEGPNSNASLNILMGILDLIIEAKFKR